MVITVANRITIQEPSEALERWCAENLVLTNPEYIKKQRMNFWTGNTPKTISLYERDGDNLILPYGCLMDVFRIRSSERDVIKVGLRSQGRVDFNCNVPLYDYQQEAVNEMADAGFGILQSPAGSGKTQMGIALAVRLSKKTLWVTHTHDLLMQSKERAERYMSPSLTGMITEGRVCIGRGITFATVQTLSRLDLSLYRDVWDTIIVDECHRVAGTPTAVTQFSKVLNGLSALHKYGLSATVHRADGMIKATYALLGEVVYEVPEEAVAEKIMKVTVRPRCTGIGESIDYLNTDGTLNYTSLVSWLTEQDDRNRLIVSDLVDNREHYNLILSDRLYHLEILLNLLPDDLRRQAVMVDGKMTSKRAKAERARALEDMRLGQKRFLFATFSLAKEGLDIPRLDRLYMTTPQKDYAVVAQSVGRIARAFEGKGEPLVYDYIDERIRYLVQSHKKRRTTYRKIGCRMEDT